MTATMVPKAHPMPEPRGELSAAVVELLRGAPGQSVPRAGSTDPFDEDLLLALHTCYELHYYGFAAVDPGWEWDPGLLGLRAEMEQRLLRGLRDAVPGGTDLEGELEELLVTPVEASGPSQFLLDRGEWWQMREYLVHRSLYHHKEADPYAWAIPRLRGQAKASLVAVEFDEFGGGRGERVHAKLYADLMAAAGLNPDYLHYLDVIPAPMFALMDTISLFGLHRELRGALVGHFATVEISSPPGARRMVEALRRLDADPACTLFYREHVEADAVHEQVMRRDVIGDLLAQEPALTESVVFGIQATNFLEDRFAEHVLGCWEAGRGSLRDGEPGSVGAHD
ncbi:iron-containing redox enzyme family protein [Nocardia bhagyanarayanae]|uniref:Heme oxygenase-like protein n=1 Tax=Nocardia bhagyanarayanae TaxID=1215925 RepID=A0A543EY52_9NOCA|nr:iron-containing redox enzyme family protein [Nocardia bhagyanarayanae]TQM26517.1 heme oxygenase-like protein [Nocardia bhagyanarayanae]